jgi:hypothetical protein
MGDYLGQRRLQGDAEPTVEERGPGFVRTLTMAALDTDARVGPSAAGAAETSLERSGLRWRAGLEALVVLSGSFAFAVFLTWPLVFHLGTRIYGPPGDSTGEIYNLWSFAHGGFHVFGVGHITATGAPFGWDQGNGVNVQRLWYIFPAYLAAKVIGEIAAYNLIVLTGLAFSGAAMYWLVRSVVHGPASPFVAAWAGFVYMVFPWHVVKAAGHAGLTHIEGFPLLLLAVLVWFRSPTLLRATAVVLATALLWLTSGYYGVAAMVALAVLLPVAAVSHRRRLGTRKAATGIISVGGGALFIVLLMSLFARLGNIDTGYFIARSEGDLIGYGARPWEYVLPAYSNPHFGTAGWLTAHLHGSNFAESSLYVGWVTILLAGGWLLWAFAARRRLGSEPKFIGVGFAAVVAAALLFSLPSPIPHTSVPTPSRLVWEVASQFRVPTRFQALVMAGLVPLAALALAGISKKAIVAFRSRAAAIAVCALFGLLSWFELSVASPGLTALNLPPAEYLALQKAPPGIVAEYPLVALDEARNSDYTFWRRVDGRRLLNGAARGSFPNAVREGLVDPLAPGTAAALSALGVSTILVHADVYTSLGVPKQAPRNLGSGYRLLGRFPDGTSMWKVTAPPAPIATFRNGFGAPELTGREPSRWLLANDGTIELYARRAGLYRASLGVVSYGQPRTVWIGGNGRSRRFVAPPGGGEFSLLLRVPAGQSILKVETRPGPEPIPDGRSVSVYMSNWQFAPAPPARAGSPRPVAAEPARG